MRNRRKQRNNEGMRLEARPVLWGLVGPSMEFEAHCEYKGKQGY